MSKQNDFLADLALILKKHNAILEITCEMIEYSDARASLEFDIQDHSCSNLIVSDVSRSKDITSEMIDGLINTGKE